MEKGEIEKNKEGARRVKRAEKWVWFWELRTTPTGTGRSWIA